MASFMIRLLITLNALMPLYVLYEIARIELGKLSNRGTEVDSKLLIYLGLNYGTRFLTAWANIIHIINMIGYFVHDIMLKMKNVPPNVCSKFKSSLDKCFYHITSGSNIFVTVIYWTLYYCKKDSFSFRAPVIGLISFSFWMDVTVHLLNTINIFLHAWTDEDVFKQKNSYWPLYCFHFVYCVWFYILSQIEEMPVYPFTDRMTTSHRMLLGLCGILVSPLPKNLIYYIGRKIYLSRRVRTNHENKKEKGF